MPDEYGNFKGTGWSQRSSDAWERVFGRFEPGARVQVTATDRCNGLVGIVTGEVIDGFTLVQLDECRVGPVGLHPFKPEELRRYVPPTPPTIPDPPRPAREPNDFELRVHGEITSEEYVRRLRARVAERRAAESTREKSFRVKGFAPA